MNVGQAVLCIAVFFSCKQADTPENSQVIDGDCTLVCSLDKITNDTTKVSLSSGNVTLWESGDELSVFTTDGTAARFGLSNGSGTSHGTFRGSLLTSASYCAVYPYAATNSLSNGVLHFRMPQVQEGVADNIAKKSLPMVAVFTAANPAPAFRNVVGLLELKLEGTARVGGITLTSANAGEMLWGDFSLTMDGNEGTNAQHLSVANGSNVLTLSFDVPVQLSENSPRSFYFAVPAGTLASGFTVSIHDGAGNLLCNQSTSRNQSVTRSRIRLMQTLSEINRISDDDIAPEPFSWAAYNNLARTGTQDETVIDPQTSGYPRAREKYVGAFYFIWHTSNSVGGGPYDVQKALGAGNYNFTESVNYGCGGGKTHHWGEPYLGYYRDDDLWVLRKHAQMLSDAGVDFIAFDVTNDAFYPVEIKKLCEVYLEMRAEGSKTPQLTFLVWHSGVNGSVSEYSQINHNRAVTYLYNTFYSEPRYADLWFQWEGKPLMMALGRDVTDPTVRNYFTFRPTWYLWNNQAQTQSDIGDPWWYDGGTEDKWPWAVCYTNDATDPMRAGTHNGVNEFCPVSPATHPVSNIGRSYPVNQGINYRSGANSYVKQPAKGIYFKSQFDAASQLDPQIMFFTGWNEFLMGHFSPGTLEFYYCGGVAAQNSMFVDQYNNEFSRDIEPIKGDFGDNYYYYMADFIRRFKGVDNVPVYSRNHNITIDGLFADWNNVSSVYADDKGDAKWRGYDINGGAAGWPAYGNTLPNYVNQTGRNDLHISKVTTDGTNLYFYVKALNNLVNYAAGDTGLNLLIRANGNTSWEGFHYMVSPTSATTASLYSCSGTGGLMRISVANDIRIAAAGNAMEVAVPLSSLGISSPNDFNIDFKWVDNVNLSAAGGEGIQQCMRDGDSAPNGRFRYRYVFRR